MIVPELNLSLLLKVSFYRLELLNKYLDIFTFYVKYMYERFINFNSSFQKLGITAAYILTLIAMRGWVKMTMSLFNLLIGQKLFFLF